MADHKLIWSPTPDTDEECFFRGPVGTPLPDADTFMDPFHSDLEGHGWMGEDGFRVNVTRDTTKHRAFGGRVVHTTQDSFESTVTVTFYEQSPNVLATVFGDDNVEVDINGGTRRMVARVSDDQLPLSSFVIRAIEGQKTTVWVIPEGRVVEVEEIEIRHDQIWSYTVTIDCYKPATGTNPDNPEAINIYIDEPDVSSGT